MGYYWAYYLAMMLATALLRYPPLLIGVVVVFLARSFLPDPVVLWRTFGRVQSLRRQIEANPANVTARRDLAIVYLDRLRPGRALELVDEARQRFPDDPELLFLKGLAHHRKAQHESALEPLVQAVDIDPRLRFGEPYLIAGRSLRALGRKEEAIDALERFTHSNGSSLAGHLELARAHRDAKDDAGSQRALEELFATWRQIPGYQRRKQLGTWMRAWIMRLFGL